jgi:hypothetical protein
MNTMEINRIAIHAEEIEPMALESAIQQSATARPQPAPKSKHEAGVRYVLLAVIALSLGSLGFYVQNSIDEINSDLAKAHANMVTAGSLGPD